MTASKPLGSYGDSVGVVTPLDHKLAHLGLITKTGAGSNAIRPGLFYDGVTNIVTGTSGMSYDVGAFTAVSSRGATAGALLFVNDGTVNVPTDAAPGSNSRIDVVYAWPREFSLDGGTTEVLIDVEIGATAASPTVPSLAAYPGAIELARITVPAGVTATNSGTTITQTAPFTTVDGGRVPIRTFSSLPATGFEHQIALVIDTGAEYEWGGAAWFLRNRPWTTYTPTFTGLTVGNGSVVGNWTMKNRVVFLQVVLTLGSTSVVDNHVLTTPTTISNFVAGTSAGESVFLDSSAGAGGRFAGPLIHNTSTTLRPNRIDVSNGRYVNVTTTAPFTWATGDQIIYSAQYLSA